MKDLLHGGCKQLIRSCVSSDLFVSSLFLLADFDLRVQIALVAINLTLVRIEFFSLSSIKASHDYNVQKAGRSFRWA